MTLTLVFAAAIVVAFLAGWKGIGLATKAKTAYSASRALTDAKKLVAKHAADLAAYNAAVALIAAQPVATGPTGGQTGVLPSFLTPTATASATVAATVAATAGPSGAVHPTPAG